MHLHQHRQPEAAGHLVQIGEVLIAEDRGDQQGRIGAGGPGLVQLIGAEDEVLAQQRQLHRLAHGDQHLEAALEERFVSEHRQAAGAACGVALGDRHRIEVFADHPLAGAGLLHLGDHRRLAAAGPQGGEEIARRRQLGHLGFQLVQRQSLAGGGHLAVLLPDDLLEDVARLTLFVGNGVFEMGHLYLGVGRPATDLHAGARVGCAEDDQPATAMAACL